tara:strand:- start:9776 stop:10177 length:402 start_codon:yes stop_codon:yes gene_type:complete
MINGLLLVRKLFYYVFISAWVIKNLLLGKKICKVSGDSMNPLILHDNYVFYKPYKLRKTKLFHNQILICNHPTKKDFLLIKRISKINSNSIEIKGDNQIESLDSRTFGVVNKKSILGIGKYVLDIQHLKISKL